MSPQQKYTNTRANEIATACRDSSRRGSRKGGNTGSKQAFVELSFSSLLISLTLFFLEKSLVVEGRKVEE